MSKAAHINKPSTARTLWPLLLIPLSLLCAVALVIWYQYTSPAIKVPMHAAKAADINAKMPSPEEMEKLLSVETLQISEEEAEEINAKRPTEIAQIAAAKPFFLKFGESAASHVGDPLTCMTQAIYYEAASESNAGQRAVAQVILNRMRHSAFPKSVCGVVYQGWQRSTGCQFSFTCDGSLNRKPSITGWARANRHAAAALSGWVEQSVGLATHYHANYVVPYWASSLSKVRTIDVHIFYMMRGASGSRSMFNANYDAASDILPNAGLADIKLSAEDIPLADELTVPVNAPAPAAAVREDNLGKLAIPQLRAVQNARPRDTVLRADEDAGQLETDKSVGTLIPR
jgi:spore germination cell wall hydrolase CwlJ-like protein